MKPVIRTKEPRIIQMQRMAENIAAKAGPDAYAVVQAEARGSAVEIDCEYGIYCNTPEPNWTYFKSWTELQDAYFKMMESGNGN